MMEATAVNHSHLNEAQCHCKAEQNKLPTLGSDTQAKCIELLIQRNHSAWEFIHRLRVTNGADPIYKLRKRGWQIETIPQPDTNGKHEIYQLETNRDTANAALKAYKEAK
ncbi:hypothetical protein [Thiomicrorhabdus indica]|uniref:hypothetical protein n=1 Tax=Thiomicrorhabdus indica TaxID=2267253 RepID=UPI002AA66689|nr:hypothetical protein [Thiomicrorhabdus indica]